MTRFKEVPDVGQLAGVIGFDPVPSNPVSDEGVAVAVANTQWITIFTYAVTTGKTCYITDLWATCSEGASGTEFLWGLRIAESFKLITREGAARGAKTSMATPIKATSGQDIDIQVYQWSGAAKLFTASFFGFEV